MPRTFICSMWQNVKLTVEDPDSDGDMEFHISPNHEGRLWLDADERRRLIEWLARYTDMTGEQS